MKEGLSEKLITAILDYLPSNKKLVSYLTDLLDLSRESAYRRIRGEIPFTLEEAVTISNQLGLSLDELAGQSNKERAFFDLNLANKKDDAEKYSDTLNSINNIYVKMSKAKEAQIIISNNRIPIPLTLNYEYIKKFRYYKWVHQTHNVPINFYFSDLEIPKKLNEDYKKYIYNYMNVKNITIIFDKNVFITFVEEILYYYDRNLINQEELKAIQNELSQILDDLERMMLTGKYKGDTNIQVYLSSLNISSNCTYLEYDNNACAQFWIYTVSPIIVYNNEVCQLQKKWLESLMKYSSLITKSNESLQADFLNEQRCLIKSMGDDL